MGLTEIYEETLEHIRNLKTTPFKYKLKEYCSDIVKNPRCIYCNKKEPGVEGGMSPKFDAKWTNGFGVCFHICHNCDSNIQSATESWLRSQIGYR